MRAAGLKQDGRERILWVLLDVLLAVVLVTGGFLFPELADAGEDRIVKKQLTAEKKSLEKEKNYMSLVKKNRDIVGWIRIPGTDIDYPVLQKKDDPLFYLHRDFHRRYSSAGSIFMDSSSDLERSGNYLIYGHHMRNGSMFASLVKYSDPDFRREHRIIKFLRIMPDGRGETQVYRVFSCYRASEADKESYLDYALICDKETYRRFIDMQRKRSEFQEKVPVYPVQIITLSTCSYHIRGHDGRYCVSACRVR